jgi:hypothetical protein|nr:MAG TPA: hypothetical protein [Caudoviricetes sp.]
MRLIDADTLKKDLESVTLSNGTLLNTNTVLLLLDKYPTAFDVDKVVEQLNEKATLSRPIGRPRYIGTVPLKEAVEIVKRGAKEQE